jgi:uncharacterized protein with von Willebrand factor type A (vWA) domain
MRSRSTATKVISPGAKSPVLATGTKPSSIRLGPRRGERSEAISERTGMIVEIASSLCSSQ